MNNPLAYGEGLGSSLMIFGALLIAGLGVWIGTLIVKARRRRAEEDTEIRARRVLLIDQR